jgi:hypothetical protein
MSRLAHAGVERGDGLSIFGSSHVIRTGAPFSCLRQALCGEKAWQAAGDDVLKGRLSTEDRLP